MEFKTLKTVVIEKTGAYDDVGGELALELLAIGEASHQEKPSHIVFVIGAPFGMMAHINANDFLTHSTGHEFFDSTIDDHSCQKDESNVYACKLRSHTHKLKVDIITCTRIQSQIDCIEATGTAVYLSSSIKYMSAKGKLYQSIPFLRKFVALFDDVLVFTKPDDNSHIALEDLAKPN